MTGERTSTPPSVLDVGFAPSAGYEMLIQIDHPPPEQGTREILEVVGDPGGLRVKSP